MRFALLCAAALLAAPVLADELVASSGNDSVRLSSSPCSSEQVLNRLKPQHPRRAARRHGRGARADFQGLLGRRRPRRPPVVRGRRPGADPAARFQDPDVGVDAYAAFLRRQHLYDDGVGRHPRVVVGHLGEAAISTPSDSIQPATVNRYGSQMLKSLAQHPRALEHVALDQLEAVADVLRHFFLHGLDRRLVVGPAVAAHAVRVRHVDGRAEVAVEVVGARELERIRQRREVGVGEGSAR